jgi:hypothetical protein
MKLRYIRPAKSPWFILPGAANATFVSIVYKPVRLRGNSFFALLAPRVGVEAGRTADFAKTLAKGLK